MVACPQTSQQRQTPTERTDQNGRRHGTQVFRRQKLANQHQGDESRHQESLSQENAAQHQFDRVIQGVHAKPGANHIRTPWSNPSNHCRSKSRPRPSTATLKCQSSPFVLMFSAA